MMKMVKLPDYPINHKNNVCIGCWIVNQPKWPSIWMSSLLLTLFKITLENNDFVKYQW